jgi:hypothetical protein
VALSRRHCSGTLDEKPEKGSPCQVNGTCEAEGGRCVTKSNEDCAKSKVCKEQARCLAKDGVCSATPEDCKKGNSCGTDGKCGVKDGQCAAVSASDCKDSSRCKLEGACSLKDGLCIAASSADCQSSSVCTKAKRCQAQGGVCIGSGKSGGGSDSSGAPDKPKSPPTISGLSI